MSTLSSNTPQRFRTPHGSRTIFVQFVLLFLAFFGALLFGALIWFLLDPIAAKRALYRAQLVLERYSTREQELKEFAFSFEKFRRDLQVLKQDPVSLRRVVETLCREQNIPFALVWAVIAVESNFNEQAVSPKGAQGLMQLMPDTAEDLDVENPLDPYQNVRGGIRYLGYLLKRFQGDYRLALAAYNAGPEAVRKHGGIPPYRETQEYVNKVLEHYQLSEEEPS